MIDVCSYKEGCQADAHGAAPGPSRFCECCVHSKQAHSVNGYCYVCERFCRSS